MSAADDEARGTAACCAARSRAGARSIRAEIAAYRAEEDAISSELARALAVEADARVALVVASEKVKVVSERFQLFRDSHEDRRDPHRQGERVRGSVPLDEAQVESLQLSDLGHQTDHAEARLCHQSSFHVADLEAATSGDPATIMAGTPDADPSGDGASVEGPGPQTGPSTSDPAMTLPVWTFGDRLRKARRFRGMDQRTLAQHFDVSASTVGLWEKNRHLPRNIAHAAQELQQILRVPAWWLLGLDRP